VVFNLVVVRIMIHMNLKSQKIKANQLVQHLEMEVNMEDLVARILLNLDTIMKISLVQEAATIHIPKVRLQTPVKLVIRRKKTIKQLKK